MRMNCLPITDKLHREIPELLRSREDGDHEDRNRYEDAKDNGPRRYPRPEVGFADARLRENSRERQRNEQDHEA